MNFYIDDEERLSLTRIREDLERKIIDEDGYTEAKATILDGPKRRRTLLYLVSWVGHETDEPSWQTARNIPPGYRYLANE